ncbi:MAG TPA: YciI family protein [Gaiellales bacterium]
MAAFVCLLTPAFDGRFLAAATPEQRAIVERHGEFLLGLQEQGRLLLAGRCWDGPLGIVIVTAADEAEARALLADDPSVVAGVQSAAIYPFSVFAAPAPGGVTAP